MGFLDLLKDDDDDPPPVAKRPRTAADDLAPLPPATASLPPLPSVGHLAAPQPPQQQLQPPLAPPPPQQQQQQLEPPLAPPLAQQQQQQLAPPPQQQQQQQQPVALVPPLPPQQQQQQQQQPASQPATPSISADSELTGQQWWLPQPKPSLDEQHSEWRPAGPLVEALQCCVCSDLLKEAITAAECGHSYCYDCIDDRIAIGGRANFCPLCHVLLGPNPWEHNKLKYDFILDALVRKVFPRPLLDAALEGRRLDREEATRQAKANINKRPGKAGGGRSLSSSQLVVTGSGRGTAAIVSTEPGDFVELALFPRGSAPATPAGAAQGQGHQGQGQASLAPLPRPYIRAPLHLTVSGLQSWLADRLEGKRGQAKVAVPNLQLLCAGTLLRPELTLQQVQDELWRPAAMKLPAGAQQQQQAAAAAAAPAAGQLPYSGEHVMLVLYEPASSAGGAAAAAAAAES